MRARILAFALCVVIVGATAELGLLVGRWTAEPQGPVIVAGRDLQPGQPIEAEDLRAVHLPLRHQLDGVFHQRADVVGRVPAEPIRATEIVRAPRLTADAPSWTLVIPRGMRAVSVPVADGPAIHKLLHPGATIDVLGTLSEDGPVTTVVEQVQVLGVHVHDGGVRLTLLVSAAQAEWVTLGETAGALRVALRADDPFTTLDPALEARLETQRDRVETTPSAATTRPGGPQSP